MTEEHDLERRSLSRHDLLKLGAAAGGAALLGTRAGRAAAAVSRLGAESGQLVVLDWAGYRYDMGAPYPMFQAYLKKYPKNKPKFYLMTNEANAIGQMSAGLKPDLFRPYVGWVKYFAENGYVQPWDPKLIKNFKHLNPTLVKAGQYQGKQYGIPDDYAFDSVLYRTDKVKPKEQSWSLLWDDRYKGKIAWFDDPVEMFFVTAFHFGFKDPYNMTDAQLEQAKNFLISKKHLVRTLWTSETSMDQQFASGDLWIAYAWPADYVAMKSKGLKVKYMDPKEKRISWVGMFMLLKNTPRYHLAHAYVDAWSAAKAGKWLEDNYSYGHANVLAKPSSSVVAKTLHLDNPRALVMPYAHLDQDVPRRAVYAKAWEEVKAA